MARSILSFQNLFCAFGLIAPPVMLLAPKGVVPVLVLLALALVASWALDRRPLGRPDLKTTACLGLLVACAAVASLWGYHPGPSLVLAIRVAAVLVAGLWVLTCAIALSPSEGSRVALYLAAGFALAVGLMVVELYFGEPIGRVLLSLSLVGELKVTRFNRGSTYLAIMAWPVAAAFWPRFGLASLAVPAVLLLLVLPLQSLAAVASLACALGVFAMAFSWVTAARRLITAGTLLVLLAAPFWASLIDRDKLEDLDFLPGTSLHRMHFWSFTAERIAESPVFGWGFNASRDIPAGDTKTYTMERTDIIPLHPHNAGLQVWLELGAVGALLLAALAWALFGVVSRLPPTDQALGLAMFSCAFLIASVSYGLWQNQWVAILMIAAVAFEICRPGRAPTRMSAEG